MYQVIVIFSQLFGRLHIKMMCDILTSSMFSVSFVLFFCFQENWRAFRTIFHTTKTTQSIYFILLNILFQNKEFLREKIKI